MLLGWAPAIYVLKHQATCKPADHYADLSMHTSNGVASHLHALPCRPVAASRTSSAIIYLEAHLR